MTEATEQHEPSYYEIALTNRQVMAAFVILLLCVLGAFFSGVWVGRGGRPERHAASSASQAQAPPPGQSMQELQFFSPKSEKTPEKPSATASPATSLATDLGKPADAPAEPVELESAPPADEPASSTAAPVASSTAPTAAPAAPPAKPITPPVVETAAPATAPAPKPTAPTAVGPTAATGSKPTTKPSELAVGEMVVQVFSSSDGEQAKKTLQRVNKGGFKAYLSPLQVGAQTMYRVRIGPFTDRASAQKVADQVRKRFKLDTWITR